MKDHATYTIQLDRSMHAFLEEMVKRYSLADVSKAVRCLVNYARDKPDQLDDIFAEIRCLDC